MLVNFNTQNQQYKQNFTAVKYHPHNAKKVEAFIKSLSPKQQNRINQIIKAQKNNPVDVYLSINNILGIKRLKAELGIVSYEFGSPASIVERAANFADKLNRPQKKMKI